ncbi:hypothetical protein ABDI30_21695 [Paenibacillus cisolokensis]
MKTPSGIAYKPEYVPDMEKMVEALRIVHETPVPPAPEKEGDEELEEGA